MGQRLIVCPKLLLPGRSRPCRHRRQNRRTTHHRGVLVLAPLKREGGHTHGVAASHFPPTTTAVTAATAAGMAAATATTSAATANAATAAT